MKEVMSMLTEYRSIVLECSHTYNNNPTEENKIQLDKALKNLEIESINSPEAQQRRYGSFLHTCPPMGEELAWQAATVFEPCYCIVSRRGNLVRHSMQCNDIAVLFNYRHTDGYSVRIFSASRDFKLPNEDWVEIKRILKGFR